MNYPADPVRDTYRTIEAETTAEIPRIKGSRFLADAWPVSSTVDVETRLDTVRKREHAASHHCYAFRLGPGGQYERYSDDGEPSGSAGLPILRRIVSHDLTDVVVVVTRYFGGTKLGTGGLVRAYGEAAEAALGQVAVAERVLREAIRIRFDYADTSPALHTLSRFDAVTRATRYGARTEMDVEVRISQADRFEAEFHEALHGRGAIERQIPGDPSR